MTAGIAISFDTIILRRFKCHGTTILYSQLQQRAPLPSVSSENGGKACVASGNEALDSLESGTIRACTWSSRSGWRPGSANIFARHHDPYFDCLLVVCYSTCHQPPGTDRSFRPNCAQVPHEDIEIPNHTIWEVTEQQAQLNGDKTAFVCGLTHEKVTDVQ